MGITLFILNRINFEQFMIFLPFVITFAVAKDDMLKTAKGTPVIIWIIALTFITLSTSCVTYEKCQNKFGITTDTIVKTQTIIIPKDSIQTVFRVDTLKKTDTIYKKSERTRLIYTYNPDTKVMNIKAICDSIVIHDTVYIPVVKDRFGQVLQKAKDNRVLYGTIAAIGLLFLIALYVKVKTWMKRKGA